MLVESHIEVANQVVALHSAGLRSNAVTPFEPCQHRLADVDTTIVHDIRLHHLVAVSRHNLCQRPSKEVVAHVSKVERLIGVRRRIFNHYQWRIVGSLHLAIVFILVDIVKHREPSRLCYYDVQESLYHVEIGNCLAVFFHPFANLLCRVFRFLFRHLEEREHNECETSLKLLLCFLHLHHLLRNVLSIECLYCGFCRTVYFV